MALQGTIDSFAVADVLRLLEASHQIGRLVVSGERGSASVWVDDGYVVDGGVVDVLRFRSGSFVFEAGVRSEAPNRKDPISDAIALALLDLDEFDRLSDRISSPSRVMCVVPDVDVDQVVLDRSAWHSIAAMCLELSVSDFGVRGSFDEVETLRRVAQLLDLGLVALADADPTAGVEQSGVPLANPVEDSDIDLAPVEWFVDDGPSAREMLPDVETPVPDTDPFRLIAPRVEADVPDGLDELFGDFDPFAGPSKFGTSDSPDGLDGLDGAEFAAPQSPVTPSGADTPESATGDDDLARQLAMLSPRAAQAVAAAVGGTDAAVGGGDDHDGREHVVRFLDSVQ